ncbi:hypothetical protein JCM19046_2935 [Bacillus sp. JCM 19046]|nr:hypothetical protein JCM19046_2935 [Bacillus sp. JCM 19046]
MNMDQVEWLVMNSQEIRRRSERVWRAIPEEYLNWRPDEQALSCGQMIRHVLEGEALYHQMLLARGTAHGQSLHNPYEGKPLLQVEGELQFAKPHREAYVQYITSKSSCELNELKIDRSDVGYVRTLGDMIMRIAYHEAVHTGQLLDYMRTMRSIVRTSGIK